MKKLTVSFFVCSCILLCMCKTPVNDTASSFPGYQPFPAGYGYLQDTAALAQAVQQGNTAYVREHAWKLWAGIQQPAAGLDWPVWFTWPSTTQTFAPKEQTALLGAVHNTAGVSLIKANMLHLGTIMDTVHLPIYHIPDPVIKKYGNVLNSDSTNINNGRHFINNGDIMIPTESLSIEGFDWIRKNNLYTQAKLDTLYANGVRQIFAPQAHIVTKHMFWPVLAGSLGVVPVWHDYYPATYNGYAGYEKWDTVVAVDPTGTKTGQTASVTYLYGVLQPDGKTKLGPITKNAVVHNINEFYYHKITQQDWDSLFDEADRAIITASSYWAYNKPFGPGDYLVTVAMHVNTKEIPTWALQSVWWSDKPADGQYAQNRPTLPTAKGPWNHYLMVDAYGIPDKATKLLPVGMNPYIELVIHPMATNCNNCHIRAGWPEGSKAGFASYQNPDCNNLLDTLNANSSCLVKYLRTDFQWLIPDHAIVSSSKKGN